MLSNAYFLAKFRFDKAENEPAKIFAKFANFANSSNFEALLCSPAGVCIGFREVHGGPGPGGPGPGSAPADLSLKVRSARDRTIRTFHTRVRSKFCQNSKHFARKFKKFRIFQYFRKYLIFAKFRKKFIKLRAKFNETFSKMGKFCKMLPKNAKKFEEHFLKY